MGATTIPATISTRSTSPPGQSFGAHTVEAADDFEYHDPVDGSDTKAQGIRIMFKGGSRIVYRLSGTGTVGATLRVYIERYEPPDGDLGEDAQKMLADLIALSRSLAEIEARTGRKEPSVVT
jgi:phosphoglucomutase